MSAEEAVESVVRKLKGPWVLAGTLVVFGVYLVKWTFPEVHADSTLTDHLNKNSLWELGFPIAGLLMVGAGLLVGVRQFRFETRNLDQNSAARTLGARVNELEQELKMTREQVSLLHKDLRQHRNASSVLAVHAVRGKENDMFVGYLDGIVSLCRDSSTKGSSEYEFWVKIYAIDSDGKLIAKYKSSSANRSVSEHHLELGLGAAGAFAKKFTENPTLQAEYYPKQAVRSGLGEKATRELDAREVRSVLCAAITPQEALVYADGSLKFEPVIKKGKRRLNGVLCFCSTVEREETSLRTEGKKRACQDAANLAGSIFKQLGLDDGLDCTV